MSNTIFQHYVLKSVSPPHQCSGFANCDVILNIAYSLSLGNRWNPQYIAHWGNSQVDARNRRIHRNLIHHGIQNHWHPSCLMLSTQLSHKILGDTTRIHTTKATAYSYSVLLLYGGTSHFKLLTLILFFDEQCDKALFVYRVESLKLQLDIRHFSTISWMSNQLSLCSDNVWPFKGTWSYRIHSQSYLIMWWLKLPSG